MNPWVRGVGRRSDYDRKVERFLAKVQEENMPDKAKMIVAINMETGEYVLGEDLPAVYKAFDERWPDTFYHICRVDGSPSMRM